MEPKTKHVRKEEGIQALRRPYRQYQASGHRISFKAKASPWPLRLGGRLLPEWPWQVRTLSYIQVYWWKQGAGHTWKNKHIKGIHEKCFQGCSRVPEQELEGHILRRGRKYDKPSGDGWGVLGAGECWETHTWRLTGLESGKWAWVMCGTLGTWTIKCKRCNDMNLGGLQALLFWGDQACQVLPFIPVMWGQSLRARVRPCHCLPEWGRTSVLLEPVDEMQEWCLEQ